VLKLYTAAWLPRLEEVTELISAQFPNERIVLRLSSNIQDVALKRFTHGDGQVLRGSTSDGPVIFLESGLRFEADVLRGQKTGFFLDQRENRRLVETLSAGRVVLNAFSFSGGFSLYAARGGCVPVTDLDISAHALAGAKQIFNSASPIPPSPDAITKRCRRTRLNRWVKRRRGNLIWWCWIRLHWPGASRNAPAQFRRTDGWRRWA
jgi:23S rRNA (cytosine1962-C5)-methyltransferase